MLSRVPSGPQTSSDTFRSGAADQGVSIRQVRQEQLRHGVHRKARLDQTTRETGTVSLAYAIVGG